MSSASSIAFTKTQIGGLVVPNRFVRSATYEAMADERGLPTQRLFDHFVKLARGGCGLIVAGSTYVTQKGRGHRFQAGMVTDEQVDAWRRAFAQVHKANGLIAVQLNHAGLESRPKYNGGFPGAGPTATSPKSKEMTVDDIEEVVDAFIAAGKRAFSAGADAIQLHAAHGYLLAEFISPLWNKRTDAFGGDVSRRFEVVRRILVGLRKELPAKFPIFIKMNGHDIEGGGVTLETALQTAKMAVAAGVDALEVSSGSGRKPYSVMGDMPLSELYPDPSRRQKMEKRFADIKFSPMFNIDYAAKVKEAVNVPIISVGGFRNVDDVNSVIAAGKCDMVSLSRPFIRNTSIVNEFKKGNASTCVNCNRCLFKTLEDKPLRCWAPY